VGESKVDEIVSALEIFAAEGLAFDVDQLPFSSDLCLSRAGLPDERGVALLFFVGADDLDFHVSVCERERDGAAEKHRVSKFARLHTILLAHLHAFLHFSFLLKLHLCIDRIFFVVARRGLLIAVGERVKWSFVECCRKNHVFC